MRRQKQPCSTGLLRAARDDAGVRTWSRDRGSSVLRYDADALAAENWLLVAESTVRPHRFEEVRSLGEALAGGRITASLLRLVFCRSSRRFGGRGAIKEHSELSSKRFDNGSSFGGRAEQGPSTPVSRCSLGEIPFAFQSPHDPRYGTRAVLEPEPREVCGDVST